MAEAPKKKATKRLSAAEHKELYAPKQKHHPDFANCRGCAQNPEYPDEQPRVEEGPTTNAVNIKHSCGRNQVGIRLVADQQQESNHPENSRARANEVFHSGNPGPVSSISHRGDVK